MKQEPCRLFVLNHPDDDCGGPLVNIKFCVMGDFSIIVVGDCQKCGTQDVSLKYGLTHLYKLSKKVRDEKLKEPKPLTPPIAIAPPKFTDDDSNFEAHGLSIIIPPDDEAA